MDMSKLAAAKEQVVDLLLRPALISDVLVRTATFRIADAVRMASRSVHAVGVGEKYTDGKPTGTMCVRIYVVQKLPRQLLPPRDLFPESIDGVPTDLIESPPAFIQGKKKARSRAIASTATAASSQPAVATATCSRDRHKRQRPMPAGISVGHRDITYGTLGYYCRSLATSDDPARVCLLSNNHVLADVNRAFAGDPILQPGPRDGGSLATDFVADLLRYVPIRLGGTANNRVDAAIGLVGADVAHRLEICSIGKVAGTTAATRDLVVAKHGARTGYTEGQVTDVSYTALVGMDHLNTAIVAKFDNQIRIEATNGFPFIGLGGDSGSMIVEKATRLAVGLYFAGPDTGEYGIANPIADVLSELQIELLQ